MNLLKLFKHQEEALNETQELNNVAYYHDMGLGKTFTGSEKMMQFGARVNLIICQKSKVDDWINHFNTYYKKSLVFDLTKREWFEKFTLSDPCETTPFIGVINYELAFRRPQLKNLEHFTLMLDESSLIQNEKAKRSKFILSLKPDNVILLSGTPTGGKYEKLWSQLNLLGWKIKKTTFYNQYVDYEMDMSQGFPLMIIKGYKNEERLKRKMREYGCHFLKTDEVFDLPQQIHSTIKIPTTPLYRKFRKDSIVYVPTSTPGIHGYEQPLVGDTTLTKMLYERQLCGQYNDDKLKAFKDLVESTEDRLIVFYNFNMELYELRNIAFDCDRPMSIINGEFKDLGTYEYCNNSITFIQYQAGAMGLNLQKANKIVYFTPPLSSELFEQSKKRTHRIGQERPCFYYYLTCANSIEERIYKTLEMRKDYTNALFESESD